MDTGQGLWSVQLQGLDFSFNLLAPNAGRAVRDALACARDLGHRRLRVESVIARGTLDRPRRRRKRPAGYRGPGLSRESLKP